MSLDNLVTVNIVAGTAGVTQRGFGIPLIAAYHTVFPERVRTYSKPDDMLTDGFTAGSAAYQAAVAIKSQTPSPSQFMVGRLAETPNAHAETLVPVATAGVKYSLDLIDQDGIVVTYEFTSVLGTVAEICAALLAAVNGGTQAITASGGVTDLVLTADNAGEVFGLRAYDDGGGHNWSRVNTTADPGMATDLAAIAVENDTWFGLIVDNQSDAIIAAAATWAESSRKLLGFDTGDTDAKGTATTDPLSDRKTAAQAFSYGFYNDQPHKYAAAGIMGRIFPLTPGAATWAHKTLANVPAVPVTETHKTNIEGKNGNWYTEVGGVNITFDGKTGAGYIDITRTIEWVKARIQEGVYALFTGNNKVPFTDGGIAAIEAVIRGVWAEGVANTALNDDLVVTVPAAADVSTVDKANRILRNVEFSGTVQGAVHQAVMNGSIGS